MTELRLRKVLEVLNRQTIEDKIALAHRTGTECPYQKKGDSAPYCSLYPRSTHFKVPPFKCDYQLNAIQLNEKDNEYHGCGYITR